MKFVIFSQGVGTGVIRGCGRQALGTIVIALGYTGALLVGVPVMLKVTRDIISKYQTLNEKQNKTYCIGTYTR